MSMKKILIASLIGNLLFLVVFSVQFLGGLSKTYSEVFVSYSPECEQAYEWLNSHLSSYDVYWDIKILMPDLDPIPNYPKNGLIQITSEEETLERFIPSINKYMSDCGPDSQFLTKIPDEVKVWVDASIKRAESFGSGKKVKNIELVENDMIISLKPIR